MDTANKLRTDRANTMVNYLQNVSNFKHRKTLAKPYASDHKLNFEVGRHNKLTLNELVKFCNLDIEDEKHFLQIALHVYHVYDNLRKTLFDNIPTNMLDRAGCMVRFRPDQFSSFSLDFPQKISAGGRPTPSQYVFLCWTAFLLLPPGLLDFNYILYLQKYVYVYIIYTLGLMYF